LYVGWLCQDVMDEAMKPYAANSLQILVKPLQIIKVTGNKVCT
jgi:hypothetical protein